MKHILCSLVFLAVLLHTTEAQGSFITGAPTWKDNTEFVCSNGTEPDGFLLSLGERLGYIEASNIWFEARVLYKQKAIEKYMAVEKRFLDSNEDIDVENLSDADKRFLDREEWVYEKAFQRFERRKAVVEDLEKGVATSAEYMYKSAGYYENLYFDIRGGVSDDCDGLLTLAKKTIAWYEHVVQQFGRASRIAKNNF